MKILELNNKKKYEITEEEFGIISSAGQVGSTALIYLPRLELSFNVFGVACIEPIPHQLEYGKPYLCKKDGEMFRVFLDRGDYIYFTEFTGRKTLATKLDIDRGGIKVSFLVPEDDYYDKITQAKLITWPNRELGVFQSEDFPIIGGANMRGALDDPNQSKSSPRAA